jgi:hypothetical protein
MSLSQEQPQLQASSIHREYSAARARRKSTPLKPAEMTLSSKWQCRADFA